MVPDSSLRPNARLLEEINDGNVRGAEQQLDAGGERDSLTTCESHTANVHDKPTSDLGWPAV